MLRFVVLLLLCVCVRAINEDDLRKTFDLSDSKEKPKCVSSIKANLPKHCHECYMCDDPKIVKNSKKYIDLTLTDYECKEIKLCCISQASGLNVRSGFNCGKREPRGRLINGVYAKRKSAREVLEGEYPWRAWIYSKEYSHQPLCAGTVVDESASFLVTQATCVLNYQPWELMVGFNRNRINTSNVHDIIKHDDYNPDKPGINDIAIIMLRKSVSKVPKWVKMACVYPTPPLHAMPCTAISDTGHSIHTVIPLLKACETSGRALHVSQICATTQLQDYAPETGGGLFCTDELRYGESNFVIYGIALRHIDGLTIYTNVSHFAKWIEDVVTRNRPRFD